MLLPLSPSSMNGGPTTLGKGPANLLLSHTGTLWFEEQIRIIQELFLWEPNPHRSVVCSVVSALHAKCREEGDLGVLVRGKVISEQDSSCGQPRGGC